MSKEQMMLDADQAAVKVRTVSRDNRFISKRVEQAQKYAGGAANDRSPDRGGQASGTECGEDPDPR